MFWFNPNLGKGKEGCTFTRPPPPPTISCWSFLNESETVKAVTLAFCSIQLHFIRNIRDKFGIPNSPQSQYIGQNSDWSISDFQVSGQSLIKENCHNSRISNDIDLKLELVTKQHSNVNYDVVSASCDVIVTFQIYGQFEAIQKPDSGLMVFKAYIFIRSKFLSYKNWKQN